MVPTLSPRHWSKTIRLPGVVVAACTMVGSAMLAGCAAPSPALTQAQMNALETREVDASRDATFRAASSALFDAGYIIGMSDFAGGLLTGEKQIDRSTDRALLNSDIPNTMFKMSIHVRAMDAARTTVRIKTSIDGTPTTDKEEVDQIWLLMQRQVLMKEPPKT